MQYWRHVMENWTKRSSKLYSPGQKTTHLAQEENQDYQDGCGWNLNIKLIQEIPTSWNRERTRMSVWSRSVCWLHAPPCSSCNAFSNALRPLLGFSMFAETNGDPLVALQCYPENYSNNPCLNNPKSLQSKRSWNAGKYIPQTISQDVYGTNANIIQLLSRPVKKKYTLSKRHVASVEIFFRRLLS